MNYLLRLPITRAERNAFIRPDKPNRLTGLLPATAKKVGALMKSLNWKCEIKVVLELRGRAFLEVWPEGRELGVWFPKDTIEKIHLIASALGISEQAAAEKIVEYSVKSPLHFSMTQAALSVEQLNKGVRVKGKEVSADQALEIERNLSTPRSPVRPRPTQPLAIELLDHVKANPDPATMGLTLIRKEHPSVPGAVMIITTSKASGNALSYEQANALAAIRELQELGWLGSPSSNRAVHVYRFIPEA